ncbi:MAG TPA: PAS domain S-box protein [Polyangiaceae bacterium]
MSELEDLRGENDSLRGRSQQLLRRALDAEQALDAFARGEVDAVALESSVTPVLLHAAQEDLRDSEQALRESRHLLEEAQTIAHLGSWASGIGPNDGLEWSRECYRIFGLPDGMAMTVDAFFACVHPADRERVQRASHDATEHGVVFDIEHRVQRPDGQVRWVHERAIVERDAAGQPTQLIGTVLDITDRHSILEALQESEERHRRLAAIVESSDDAILSATLDGQITSWNQGAEKLFGYRADEVLGRSISLLASPATRDDEDRVFACAARGEAVRQHETARRRKDGAMVEVALTVSPLRDATGAVVGFSKIVRDLTSHRLTEVALRRTEEQFRQAQKMEAVGRLAGGVAHDFNNLLTVILSYSRLALDELKPGDPLHNDIEQIEKAGNRATELTRQLLAFSRQQILQPQVVDLNQIVAGTKSMLARLIGEDVELTTLFAPNAGRVLADPGQIEQVLMNLAVNARDAMPDGGKLTIETINVKLDALYVGAHLGVAPGDYLMLAISDTGVGMDAATQARIFEPFFTTKEKGKGTGLGLSTVFGIVEQSGGHIRVYSEPGCGCTFKIYLPRTDRIARQLISVAPSKILEGAETILLVEDEEQVRDVAGAILRRNGYNVLTAANGGEAFLISKDFTAKIHLLLTDVVMPKMSGRKLAAELALQRPQMKVLFASGYTDDAIIHHGVLDAGVAFLQKPFTPDGLLRRVREVLDASESAPSKRARF